MFAIPVQVVTLAGNCLVGGLSYYFGANSIEDPNAIEEEAQLVDSTSLDPFPEIPLYENSRITVRKTMDALCELQSFHPEISEEAMDDICSLLREALLPARNSLDRSWPAKLTRGVVQHKRQCREVNGRVREGKDENEELATVAPTIGDVSFDDFMHRLILDIKRDDEESRTRKEEAQGLLTKMDMGAMGDQFQDLVKENESLKAFMEAGLVELCESVSISADATLSAVDMSFKKMNGRLNYCKAILKKARRPSIRRVSASSPSEEELRLEKKLEAARSTIKTLRRRLKTQGGLGGKGKMEQGVNGTTESILDRNPLPVLAVNSLDDLEKPTLQVQRSNTEMPAAQFSSFKNESGYCSDDGAGETPLIRSLPAVSRNSSLPLAQAQNTDPPEVDSPVQGSRIATLQRGVEE